MLGTISLNSWTKIDGMVITLVSLWLLYKETEDKNYVHVSELIGEGFKSAVVYDFYDNLVRNGLAESYNRERRSTRPLLRPTAKGITTFLDIYKSRLNEKSKTNKSQIEVVLLKETCKALEKLQVLFFSSPGK